MQVGGNGGPTPNLFLPTTATLVLTLVGLMALRNGMFPHGFALQWRYEPTLVNEAPAEVDTTVSVVFPPPVKQGPRISNK